MLPTKLRIKPQSPSTPRREYGHDLELRRFIRTPPRGQKARKTRHPEHAALLTSARHHKTH